LTWPHTVSADRAADEAPTGPAVRPPAAGGRGRPGRGMLWCLLATQRPWPGYGGQHEQQARPAVRRGRL